jgi:hypothetical protein
MRGELPEHSLRPGTFFAEKGVPASLFSLAPSSLCRVSRPVRRVCRRLRCRLRVARQVELHEVGHRGEDHRPQGEPYQRAGHTEAGGKMEGMGDPILFLRCHAGGGDPSRRRREIWFQP